MTAVGVVVVAAGSGERLGDDGPKALVQVAGRPLVAHALDRLVAAGLAPPVVVHPPGRENEFAQALDGRPCAALVAGGRTRTDSVRVGVGALGAVEVVAIHDAARGLMPAATIRAAVAAVTGDVVAAAPGLPVADTLKQVDDAGQVLATVDRAGLVGIQTPQVFTRAALDAALALGVDATDDLALVERLVADGGLTGRVVVVPGSPFGLKVTYPRDLEVAALLAQEVSA